MYTRKIQTRTAIDRINAVIVYTLGAAAWVALLIGLMAGIEHTVKYPPLSSGTVTAKSYDDGHTWTSSVAIGNFELIQTHGDGTEHFSIQVEKNGKTDWWEISKEIFDKVEVGQYVEK